MKSIRIDARNEKASADASTLKMVLMHGAEKQGGVHHFLSSSVRTTPVLAWASLQGLIPPSGHANAATVFPADKTIDIRFR